MNRWRLALLLAFTLLTMSGCAKQMGTKAELYPLMYENEVRSILVLPPINESTAADAPLYYSTTIHEPLVRTGYYVLPYEVSVDILAHEGITDGQQLYDMPLQTFKDFFGADAVLFTRIKKWDTAYAVVASNLTVSVECELRSTKTNERLWNYAGTVVIDLTGHNTAGGLGGLIAQVVITAMSTAMADYVPYAKQANYYALAAMPAGPYSPYYRQDGNAQVVILDNAHK